MACSRSSSSSKAEDKRCPPPVRGQARGNQRWPAPRATVVLPSLLPADDGAGEGAGTDVGIAIHDIDTVFLGFGGGKAASGDCGGSREDREGGGEVDELAHGGVSLVCPGGKSALVCPFWAIGANSAVPGVTDFKFVDAD
jgi:hypothetical protein